MERRYLLKQRVLNLYQILRNFRSINFSFDISRYFSAEMFAFLLVLVVWNYFHSYGDPHVSRQNLLSHGKSYSLAAKHTFSRQKLPSRGKIYFLTAKITFSRQNLLSHGKIYFLAAKIFTLAFHNFINRNGRLINVAAEEDAVDECTKTLGLMQHGNWLT